MWGLLLVWLLQVQFAAHASSAAANKGLPVWLPVDDDSAAALAPTLDIMAAESPDYYWLFKDLVTRHCRAWGPSLEGTLAMPGLFSAKPGCGSPSAARPDCDLSAARAAASAAARPLLPCCWIPSMPAVQTEHCLRDGGHSTADDEGISLPAAPGQDRQGPANIHLQFVYSTGPSPRQQHHLLLIGSLAPHKRMPSRCGLKAHAHLCLGSGGGRELLQLIATVLGEYEVCQANELGQQPAGNDNGL